MIEDVIEKNITDQEYKTAPYIDFLSSTGKTGEGIIWGNSNQYVNSNQISFIETVYSLTRAFFEVLQAVKKEYLPENLNLELPSKTSSNCNTLLGKLEDYAVKCASDVDSSKSVVGWSYTRNADNFSSLKNTETRKQYFIPYFTYNVVNLLENIIPIKSDSSDAEGTLKSFSEYLNDLFDWITNEFILTDNYQIANKPINFDENGPLLNLGPSGFPLYDNVYIVSILILTLKWKMEMGEEVSTDKDFKKRVQDIINNLIDVISNDADYKWDRDDDSMGEHMFRLQGNYYKKPISSQISHRKVYIDRSIYPMLLRAVTTFGLVFDENMDNLIQPLLNHIMNMKIKMGRYKGMWYGHTTSIYYTNRVVDALSSLYEYVIYFKDDTKLVINDEKNYNSVENASYSLENYDIISILEENLSEFVLTKRKATKERSNPKTDELKEINNNLQKELKQLKIDLKNNELDHKNSIISKEEKIESLEERIKVLEGLDNQKM